MASVDLYVFCYGLSAFRLAWLDVAFARVLVVIFDEAWLGVAIVLIFFLVSARPVLRGRMMRSLEFWVL